MLYKAESASSTTPIRAALALLVKLNAAVSAIAYPRDFIDLLLPRVGILIDAAVINFRPPPTLHIRALNDNLSINGDVNIYVLTLKADSRQSPVVPRFVRSRQGGEGGRGERLLWKVTSVLCKKRAVVSVPYFVFNPKKAVIFP